MYLGFSASKITSIVLLLLALFLSLLLSDIPCIAKWISTISNSSTHIPVHIEGYTAAIQQQIDNELYSENTNAQKVTNIEKILKNGADVENDVMAVAYMKIINSTDLDDPAKVAKMKKVIVG